ncbi:hypothetical protein OpiT1DRAFT_04499 [Opitutaceae bacterium TAV1]|nr:hypothetical protein OpiT1DRAFT_04499 [Opitutaceae bacterium TAV1]
MKNPAFLHVLAAIALISGSASAGPLVTGKAIEFLAADFDSSGGAQKSWAIYNPAQTSDTEVWDLNTAALAINNRIANNNANGGVSYVTWKITVPETVGITGFTWAVRQLILDGAKNGAGDDTFAFQYSLTGTDGWTPFYTQDNRGSASSTLTASNLVLNVNLPESVTGTAIHAIWIRATHIEGTGVAGDSGYWAVVSNTASTGGIDANSYVKLQVQPIPEPAQVAVALAGVAVFLAAIWRGRLKAARSGSIR